MVVWRRAVRARGDQGRVDQLHPTSLQQIGKHSRQFQLALPRELLTHKLGERIIDAAPAFCIAATSPAVLICRAAESTAVAGVNDARGNSACNLRRKTDHSLSPTPIVQFKPPGAPCRLSAIMFAASAEGLSVSPHSFNCVPSGSSGSDAASKAGVTSTPGRAAAV